VIDPATGDASTTAGELVLTQLGMRGSALLRWRTGDLVSAVTASPCPSCGRRVPRAEGLHRGALVTRFESGRAFDLRSVTRVLAARGDIRDWRLVVGRRNRDGVRSVVVHFEASNPYDPATPIGIATDVRHVTGSLPTQLVAATRDELTAVGRGPLSPRILLD
jgi:phenylacetate-coenzyme A ligase PaaK-like adenylate-forming protein